jgi:serine/threonine protein phosphatase PrpC
MRTVASGISDIGRKRDRNEDAFLINDELQLFVVADGMGGHAGGEYASALAVNTVEDVLLASPSDASAVTPAPEGSDADPVEATKARLVESVRLAGARIHDWATDHPEHRGMGTTVVALLIQGHNAFLAHVGDSRIYALRDGKIQQATDDHSLVAQSIREGLITEEQAKSHRMRNVITRALGFERAVEVDVQARALLRGDAYLLCSDGLSGKVDEAEMCELVFAYPPQEAARQLIGLANARGGEDNITAVVVRVEGK